MSGNGYGYFYTSQNFTGNPNQNWSEWSVEQQQYNESYGRTNSPHIPLNHSSPSNSYTSHRSQNFYNANNRHFQQQRRFPAQTSGYTGQQQQTSQNWQRNNYHNKRPRPHDSPGENNMESKSKSSKKKKKPLSQNVPSKKDWTPDEAILALNVEKEYNKRYKNHSLIIKFPDLELNRDIVSKFHTSIENVHFQQPSTPRFCFVTLKETADAEAVITHLNTIKFGDGHLTAEYKKDREEDQNIGPEDIDPLTLYVGNLAQEITKEDMVKTYPKSRRIDIGYAKKMKYTRYAFVSFKNVTDSIEAFKKTHSTQMYSKSLIVRFRRLHGTVGMPGDSKPQSPAKSKSNSVNSTETQSESQVNVESSKQDNSEKVENAELSTPIKTTDVDLSVVKQEVNSSDDELEGTYVSPFMAGSIDDAFGQHRPMVKKEIKQEVEEDISNTNTTDSYREPLNNFTSQNGELKTETGAFESAEVKNERDEEEEEYSDEDGGEQFGNLNFSSLLNQLVDHSNQIDSLRKSIP